jgi:cytochrome c oxidase assembly factor CtaG
MTGPPYGFTFEPFFLLLGALVVVAYVRAARRLAPSEKPGTGRRFVFGLGVALVVAPLNSPLETISTHYLLLFHLLQNALIADWGPPLLILGLTPGMRERLGRAGGTALRRVTSPFVALPVWLVVWYGVHVPAFYDWALRASWPLNIEHALLVGAGLLFWWPVFEHPRRLPTAGVLAYLGIAFVSAPWLSLAYIFSSSPYYSFYAHAPRLWGLSAVHDQNYAGILMNADQTSVFFIAFAWFLLGVLAEEEEQQRRRDAAFLATYDGPAPTGVRKQGETT